MWQQKYGEMWTPSHAKHQGMPTSNWWRGIMSWAGRFTLPFTSGNKWEVGQLLHPKLITYGLVDKGPMRLYVSSHQWFWESPRETSWNSTCMRWMIVDFIHCGKRMGRGALSMRVGVMCVHYPSLKCPIYTLKKTLNMRLDISTT